ncbi:fumarylacetoacetate hydrolase family protein [Saccharopolyspora phatthalungensis]|uniref:2-keto-4-pentenoate hydratase/2-oxohepta-3-ene-1,7-dioic acid hydratase in catechol pathway n=1 Tax=Saccharopolyspora phatthalungensis TaxID=664693 RepID=A0A840QE72_9PSEU|nr:fumarylacetoacetate hydrolase family protein [Saccharopolyspora phatthalungensis]MBB5156968.1 2-keto-4-pentenoate hydratase/2-oxohepta-3-ene-1,7-dioic acid hydratase in catechol pathway [Saccharopolyspora phatthalungensis]
MRTTAAGPTSGPGQSGHAPDDAGAAHTWRGSTWSLASVDHADGGAPRAVALCGDSLVEIPGLDGADVTEVIARWPEFAPLLRSFDPAGGQTTTGTLRAPLRAPGKLVCAGANYRGHLTEMGIAEVPGGIEPYFFLLPSTSITGPDEQVRIPPEEQARVDWEAELAVVIGTPGRDIPEADALAHVAGYTIMNDVSARGLHRRANPLAPPFTFDWLASKGRDTFSPLGPGITPAWLVPDPQNLHIRLWRNGKLEQDGYTADMLFPVARLIAAASEIMCLEAGDVLATGTPAGVGVAHGAALVDGDDLRVEITDLGTLRNPVRVAHPALHA